MILQKDEEIIQKEIARYYENINDKRSYFNGLLILTNKRLIFEGTDKSSNKFWMLGFNLILNVKGEKIGFWSWLFGGSPYLIIASVNESGMQRTLHLKVKDPLYWKTLLEEYASGMVNYTGKNLPNANISINLGQSQHHIYSKTSFNEMQNNEIKCIRCGMNSSPNSKYCNNCGQAINGINTQNIGYSAQNIEDLLKKRISSALDTLKSDNYYEGVSISLDVSLVKTLSSFFMEMNKRGIDIETVTINSIGLYLSPNFVFNTSYNDESKKEPLNILIDGQNEKIIRGKNRKYGDNQSRFSADLSKYWISPEYQKFYQMMISMEQSNILSKKVNFYDDNLKIGNPEMAKTFLIENLRNEITNSLMDEPIFSEVMYRGTKWGIDYYRNEELNEAIYNIEEKRFLKFESTPLTSGVTLNCPVCNYEVNGDVKYCPRCASELKN